MTEPNDILIRITRTEDGFRRDVMIAVNDETLLPEMERTAAFLSKCLEIFASDAAVGYHDAIQYAERLAAPRIKLLNS